MLEYYITDRRLLGGVRPLLANIERQIAAGVDWIQLREKDLPARDLCELARRVVSIAGRTKILINSRVDLALAVGAHGVHLPSRSPAPGEFKRIAPYLMFGVSCHDAAELVQAERDEADYALLSPVFAPLSKTSPEAPLGVEKFAELSRTVGIPVIALGGIDRGNVEELRRVKAAGIAGISLFQQQGIE